MRSTDCPGGVSERTDSSGFQGWNSRVGFRRNLLIRQAPSCTRSWFANWWTREAFCCSPQVLWPSVNAGRSPGDGSGGGSSGRTSGNSLSAKVPVFPSAGRELPRPGHRRRERGTRSTHLLQPLPQVALLGSKAVGFPSKQFGPRLERGDKAGISDWTTPRRSRRTAASDSNRAWSASINSTASAATRPRASADGDNCRSRSVTAPSGAAAGTSRAAHAAARRSAAGGCSGSTG